MRRSASEIINELETRIARLERQANMGKESATYLRRVPKLLKAIMITYVQQGGRNTKVEDLENERITPELVDALKAVGVSSWKGMSVWSLMYKFMPQAYYATEDGYGDEYTKQGYHDDIREMLKHLIKKQTTVRTRAPRGSKIELVVQSARGDKKITKSFRPTDTVYTVSFGLEEVRSYSVTNALEIQQEEIARHGRPITEFLANERHPEIARLRKYQRRLDERGYGMN